MPLFTKPNRPDPVLNFYRYRTSEDSYEGSLDTTKEINEWKIMKKNILNITQIILTTLVTMVVFDVASAQDVGSSQGAGTWRIEMANDVLFDSDNSFTNGFNIQQHSALFGDIDELPGGTTLARADPAPGGGALLPSGMDNWPEYSHP